MSPVLVTIYTVDYVKCFFFLNIDELRRLFKRIDNDLNKVYGLMYQYEVKMSNIYQK